MTLRKKRQSQQAVAKEEKTNDRTTSEVHETVSSQNSNNDTENPSLTKRCLKQELDDSTTSYEEINFNGVGDLSLDTLGNELGKIFVGGLSHCTQATDLRQHFTQFGAVLGAKVAVDRDSGQSRGFGYVQFQQTDAVDAVMKASEHWIDGRRVEIQQANVHQRGKSRRSTRVFVGGVAINHDVETLWSVFSEAGPLVEIQLHLEQGGVIRRTHEGATCPLKKASGGIRHRGFAFITFANVHTARKVIAQKYFMVKDRVVEVKAMEPLSQRPVRTCSSVHHEESLCEGCRGSRAQAASPDSGTSSSSDSKRNTVATELFNQLNSLPNRLAEALIFPSYTAAVAAATIKASMKSANNLPLSIPTSPSPPTITHGWNPVYYAYPQPQFNVQWIPSQFAG